MTDPDNLAAIDLKRLTGLPLVLEGPGRLVFQGDLPPVEPAERPWDELRAVVMEPHACPEGTAYLMYRDICWPRDRGRLEEHRVRYDLTVIPPAWVGREPVRTHGHYHAVSPDGGLTYPELYQVVHGRAWFLLQKPGPGGAEALVAVKAGEGEYVLVPPGYGHVTVNVGRTTLVVANWVERHFASSFTEVRNRRGFAYYVVRGQNGLELAPNPAYEHPVPARVVSAFQLGVLSLDGGTPSYPWGACEPGRLAFLVSPADHRELFARAWREGGLEP